MATALFAAIVAIAVLPASAGAVTLVALGDSYSSGEGAKPYDSDSDRRGNKCHRGSRAWPRLIGASHTNLIACSGAETKHLSAPKQEQPPDDIGQLVRLGQAVKAGTVDVVTITMGGNDIGFGPKMAQCFFSRCLGNMAAIEADLRQLKGDLVQGYKSIVKIARGARLVVVGYPDIVPAPGEGDECAWLGETEKNRAAQVSEKLNATIAQAAAAVDVKFVSVRNALDGRELCTEDSWMRPIGRLFGEARQEMGHPNARGQQAIADAVRGHILPPPACHPTSNVAAIIDDSGSMRENDPTAIRRRALELLITKPSASDETLGAVEFGSLASPLFAPDPLSDAGKRNGMLTSLEQLQDDGSAFDSGESTNYAAAFDESLLSQPDAGARIFLTDGGHNEGPYEDDHRGGPPTYVIGLNIGPQGSSEEADLAARIAAETGGRYFPLAEVAGEDTQSQLNRLQPAINEIDALLDCATLRGQAVQSFNSSGQAGPRTGASFKGVGALEIVASWSVPGTDIALDSAVAKNRKGKVIADLAGTRRIKHTKRRRARLSVNTVSGETFETITVQRPRRGRKLVISLEGEQVAAPTEVSVQIRAVPRGALPGATEVGGDPASPASGGSAPAGTPQPLRRVITVYNMVTNGPTQMREDPVPARLTTKPWTFCSSRGCNINGTERTTGGAYDAAVCWTTGDLTTNGHNADPSDDGNPNLYTSDRYYGVRLANGTFGYVSWVWINAAHRGGLGLPPC